MKFYLLPEPLSTLDIETLDLGINCVIDEIGMIQTNFLPHPSTPGPVNLREVCHHLSTQYPELQVKVREFLKWPDVLLQILEGRTWNESAIEFREKVMRAATPTIANSFKERIAGRKLALAESGPEVIAKALRVFHKESTEAFGSNVKLRMGEPSAV